MEIESKSDDFSDAIANSVISVNTEVSDDIAIANVSTGSCHSFFSFQRYFIFTGLGLFSGNLPLRSGEVQDLRKADKRCCVADEDEREAKYSRSKFGHFLEQVLNG